MRRALFSIIGVAAAAAILVGINMLADARLANAQLDVTQGHVYTLAKGTRQILRGLKEPITLRLFYSPLLGTRVPSYGGYYDRVREMLTTYARDSHGRVKLEFYNPEPFSDVEDRALGYGLQGVPLDRAGERVYFGLVGTNLLDDVRTIPFLDANRDRFLEYDLTRLVYDLSNPKRPVVGVMSSLPLEGASPEMMMRMGQRAGRPWVSMMELRQTFDVHDIPLNTWSIPGDVQVLLVAQAQHLPEQAQYAIDQFVMRGGRLMAMVDPQSEAEFSQPGPNGLPQMDVASDLPKLFDAWGIAYDPKQAVGDLTGAWRVRAGSNDRLAVVDYVPWFNIRDGLNKNDPASADLSQVTVAAPGFVAKKPGAAIEFTPLLTSSKLSGVIPADKLRLGTDPATLLADFKPAGGPRVIAARVRGVLHSAFTAPPEPAKGEQRPAELPAFRDHTDGAANLVVFADSDILADRYWVHVQDFFGQEQATPFSDNGAFVANLIGTLAGGDALISLRGRGVAQRPFVVVDNMQRRAEAQFEQTQQALKQHLQDTEKKLADLQQGSGQQGTAAAVLTPEQQAAITQVNHEILDTRRQLRAVQFDLKRGIDRLESALRLFDIVLVPALLAVLAIVLGLVRVQRRAHARA
ncbi:MAG: Gldg family protein [Alphaproteobacteria bacterium]|nr:Gldg family protein [Alphaproteobacteria bacterium]